MFDIYIHYFTQIDLSTFIINILNKLTIENTINYCCNPNKLLDAHFKRNSHITRSVMLMKVNYNKLRNKLPYIPMAENVTYFFFFYLRILYNFLYYLFHLTLQIQLWASTINKELYWFYVIFYIWHVLLFSFLFFFRAIVCFSNLHRLSRVF